MQLRLCLCRCTPSPHPCASPDATLFTLMCRWVLGGRPLGHLSRPRAAGGVLVARRGVVRRSACVVRGTGDGRGQPIFTL